ncbi:MAG: hypothetical protein KBA71_14295 [Opitutaceae bacterium]|nr:hypothetical protein [Opitutaceae bacterium]
MSASDSPPPLPSDPVAVVAGFTPPSGGATPLGSVIRAMLSLELKAWMGPKLWVKMVCAALALVVLTRLALSRSNPAQFERWMLEVVALRFVPLLCLAVGGGILRNAIRSYTIEYLWTRSVRKFHLVIAAWLTAVVVVTLLVFMATAMVHLTGSVTGVEGIWRKFPMTCTAEFALILPFTAIAVALGVWTGKYMVTGLLYGFVVETGISRIPTNLNLLAVSRHAEVLLKQARQSLEGPGLLVVLQSTGALMLLTAAGLLVACIIFVRKQYSIGAEKEI